MPRHAQQPLPASRAGTRATAWIGVLALSASASAQSNIDPINRFAWGENIGFVNFHDAGAPPGAQGVRVEASFLSGSVWSENTGFWNLGDGSPADGLHYANADDTDFGVNLDPATGELFGLAWAENLGWVNFDTRLLAPFDQHARVEAGRLRGYAWSRTVGWINLDDDTIFVALACPPDLTGSTNPTDPLYGVPDGILDANDFFYYLDRFAAGDLAAADLTGSINPNDPSFGVPDGTLDANDFFFYLDLFAIGCG